MRLRGFAALGMVAGAGAICAGPIQAQNPAPPITVELNKLEPADQACRLFLLLQNQSDETYDALTLELVSFDKDGLIGQRLAVDLAPVRARKTSVRLFDLPDTSCDGLGRVLLNDVSACSIGGAAVDGCLDRLQVSSRGPVPLFK
ncbi:MAG: Tat pathway signal sequence domain protein [Geminicoccaceae bacterium]